LIVAGNIASAINADIRKCKVSGEESRFISYGRGLYGLSECEPKGIFADIRDKNNLVKKRLLGVLQDMPPSRFEELVGEVLRCLGFENITVVGKSGDGGIDVVGELVVAGTIKNNVCVQVKRWQHNVQRANIAELRGSLRPHQSGLYVTTSDFSKPAIEEANDLYKAPISLINGREFVDLLCEYGIGVTSENVVIYEMSDATACLPETPTTGLENNGIEIFAKFKGQTIYAVLFSQNKVAIGNEIFKSPSAAGTKVQNGRPVNGWKFWKYVDSRDGKVYPIDRIRHR
jgi:hypothetical protein